MQELEFTCPECGSHDLEAVQEEITAYSRVSAIYSDGSDDWVDYDAPSVDDCDIPESALYQCASCGHELKDESGRSVIGETQLFDWLRDNDNHKGSEEDDL